MSDATAYCSQRVCKPRTVFTTYAKQFFLVLSVRLFLTTSSKRPVETTH